MKIGLIYFSATGNTLKIASEISKILKKENYQVLEYDITSLKNREKTIPFNELDFVIFGFPIYGRKPPKVVRNWIEKITAENKPCVMFFTYGGVMRGGIHVDTKNLLESQGFVVIGSAEFLAQHSFNVGEGFELLKGHPNKQDLDIVEQFTKELIKKIERKDFKPMELPFIDDKLTTPTTEQVKQKPLPRVSFPKRVTEICSMCYDCEELCSSGAFDAKKGLADEDTCIRCFRCILICPDNVIEINNLTDFYTVFRERLNLTDELLESRKSQYFI